ncbi:DUF4437 domain-containing protein [Magnetococcus sp. PR-3]|uniref:DUF4437 domain-containing protein n=1 Tax=Magnetococcus sp. PR-3 TaxID=3120355 RepID=UPI002FCE3A6C
MKSLKSLMLAGVLTASFTFLQTPAMGFAAELNSNLLLRSQVDWEQLNPARGDKSPQAGTLWGDRKGTVPTGFLVKFVDGFASPSHIHNVSYRGVVISGLIHNDDPKAADMWMPQGSFWTQPKGESHITAAKGRTNVAYIEIEEGPYLVHPAKQAFDSGERPVNIDSSNIVWLDASNINWVDQSGMSASDNGPKVAFLWGNPQDDQLNGSFIKLPPGFKGKIHSQGSTFRAVIIKGQPQYQLPGKADVTTLEPGSYFSSKGETLHKLSSNDGEESLVYVRTNGQFRITSAR